METNPINKGVISRNFSGVGTVSRELINKRARELAFLSGRSEKEITDAEYEQARRELSGGSDLDRQQEIIDALPESERWDPVPGSAGTQAAELPDEDEDSEGRSESAQLVEDGAREAEHDQMIQAEESARKAEKPDLKVGR
jgi:hypothetical protein